MIEKLLRFQALAVFIVAITINIACIAQVIVSPPDSLPFKYIDARIIITPAINDSIKTTLLIDTGSKSLTLDSIFLTKINSFVIKDWSINSKGLDADSKLYYLATIKDSLPYLLDKINFRINDAQFEVEQPKGGSISLYGIDGILGLDCFAKKNKIIEIDIQNKVIILTEEISNKYKEIPFAIDKKSGGPLIELTILVKTPTRTITLSGKFLIDTGFRPGLLLPESLIKEFAELPIQESVYFADSKGKLAKNKYLENIPVSLNGEKELKLKISFSPNVRPSMNGIIGMEVLENIRFALDYQKKKFYYVPFDNNTSRPPQFLSMYGIVINYMMYLNGTHDHIYVCQLTQNGKAAQLGIKLNDVVLKINDIDVQKINEMKILNNIENITSITIRKENGNICTLE